MEDYRELADYVEDNSNLVTVDMEVLAEVHGAGRLGKHVRRNIGESLRGAGLGYHPNPLPNSQYKQVRLFKLGQPESTLIQAVLNPGEEEDKEIRRTVDSSAEQTIRKVRELVCD